MRKGGWKTLLTVRCPCCKHPVGLRLDSFPRLPTLVFSSHVSQSGKDLFTFHCGFFFITPQPRRPNCKGQRENRDRFCTTPEHKDPVLLLVVKADRQEKMPLFFLSQSQEFHWPKHQAQGALSPPSSASRNTSHC